jgi:hypothetical protein
MKRMKVLFGQRRVMVLATLAILVLAAAALAASSASFTATSANPDNVFSTGALSIGNYQSDGVTSNEGHAVANLSMSAMKPGDFKTGTAVIENAGTVSGNFTLSAVRQAGDATLYGQLTCVVKQDTVQIYAGNVSGLSALALTAAPWAAGARHTYDITVTFPASSGDTFQNLSTTVQFNWDAVSD